MTESVEEIQLHALNPRRSITQNASSIDNSIGWIENYMYAKITYPRKTLATRTQEYEVEISLNVHISE